MNLTVEEDKRLDDIYVNIACPQKDEEVERIVAQLQGSDVRITGALQGKVYPIDPDDIYYIESVEKRTFLYGADKVFESPLRLYQLEDRLMQQDFVRISKQMIVNFDKVSAIKPDINARLQLVLSNGERVIASRQYAPAIKKKLGL